MRDRYRHNVVASPVAHRVGSYKDRAGTKTVAPSSPVHRHDTIPPLPVGATSVAMLLQTFSRKASRLKLLPRSHL